MHRITELERTLRITELMIDLLENRPHLLVVACWYFAPMGVCALVSYVNQLSGQPLCGNGGGPGNGLAFWLPFSKLPLTSWVYLLGRYRLVLEERQSSASFGGGVCVLQSIFPLARGAALRARSWTRSCTPCCDTGDSSAARGSPGGLGERHEHSCHWHFITQGLSRKSPAIQDQRDAPEASIALPTPLPHLFQTK